MAERLAPCLTLSSYTNNVGGRLLESYSNTCLQADMRTITAERHMVKMQIIFLAQTPVLKPTCKSHCPVDPEAVLLPARAALTFANLERAVVLQGILGLQALGARILAEGRHGLLGRAVLQQSVEHHAGLLLDAALLGHQAVKGRRHWRATCETDDTVNISTNTLVLDKAAGFMALPSCAST